MPRIHRFFAPAVVLAMAIAPFAMLQSGCAKKVAELTMMPSTPLPDLKTVGLPMAWQRQISLDAGERIKNAWRVGVSVYVATSYSRIVRIDAKSGVMDWSIGLGEENFDIYRPIELPVAGGGPAKQVLVVTRGEAFEIELQTGVVQRSADLGLSVSADPLVIGNTLCVEGAGRVYGLYLDRLNGHRWLVTEPGDLFLSTPAVVDTSSLIVASESGHLWRVNGESGDWEWKDRKTNGNVTAPLSADTRAVFVPCLDQRMYAFSVESGGELWETPLDGTLETKPRLGGTVVMVISNQRGLYGLARRDGKIEWNVPAVSQIATVGDSAAWVGTRDGMIQSVSLDTGAVLASAEASGVQILVPNTVDQNVILVTQAGLVGMYQGKAVAGP